MKKVSKVLVLIVCFFMLTSVFTGCGDKSKAGTVETQDTGTAEKTGDEKVVSKEPVTIKFIHWRNEDANTYKKLIQMFEEKNPNVKVDMEITTANQADYYTLLKSRLVAGESVDVYFAHPGAHLYEMAQAGYCEDFTGKPFVNDYLSSLIPAGRIDDKVCGLVQCYNVFTVFYNKKIFGELGLTPPKTFNELAKICDTVKANKYEPIATGFAEAWTADIFFLTLLGEYANGDEMIYSKLEEGKVKYTDEPYVSVFKAIQEMGGKGMFQKNATGTKYEASLALFAQGKAAMLNTGTWSVGGLKSQNKDLEFGVFVLPSPSDKIVPTLAVGQAVCVNAKSARKDEAMQFVEFLSSKEAAAIYGNETGQLVGIKDVKLDVPELAEVSELLSGESITAVNTFTKNPKTWQISQETGIKAALGQDLNKTLEEAQKQLDAALNQ